MSDKFVWSGATGANNGSSWDNAYTSVMRDWSAEGSFDPATDTVYVRSVHSESAVANLTLTGTTGDSTTAPCRIVCVVGGTTGTTPGALATGASVTVTGSWTITTLKQLYIYGVHLFSDAYMYFGFGPDGLAQVFDECRIEVTDTDGGSGMIFGNYSGSNGSVMLLRNVVLDFGHNQQGIAVRNGVISWIG